MGIRDIATIYEDAHYFVQEYVDALAYARYKVEEASCDAESALALLEKSYDEITGKPNE